ncbi:MAG: zinc-ribbon domain containing protein [Kiritimatiellia bacterium]
MNTAERKRIPINKELWSEKSRTGLDYVFAEEFYEDKPFQCRACGASSVFTAEQQKYTYEEKKAYTWEEHVLCSDCFKVRNQLSAESLAFLAVWVRDKRAAMANLQGVCRWKEILELLPRYGVRKDTARIRMLSKVLSNAA